ncbi:unnamed protein product [Cuscuta epithymum]|uniref:K Homology domain-containing protein n=1 Tax=Cuscuta epithymum TaxID=186058 RepID=A0AAV0E035_9ASTE|nr:unnamed protein product [Cuscuta epithymum]CAH9126712.1 unnamed protein product [Cuscuta epithymum]
MGAENGNTEDKSGESKEYNSIQLDKSPEVDNERTEEKKGDGSKVDDTGEKPAGLDVSLQLDNNISQLDNGPMLDNEAPKTTIDRQQTPIVDDLQTTNIQQSSSTEKELHNTPEVDNEAPKTAISEQLARIDDLQTSNDKKSNNSEKLETHDNSEEQSKSEDQEPPSCVPQHGDALNDQEKILVLDTQSVSHKMEVPNNKVGVLIGKSGETIRHLQYNSGAKIQITRDADSDPHSITRSVTLIGTTESISKAEKLIKDVITEADAGGSPSLVARGFNPVQSVVGDQIELQVPIEKVGLIIGRNGETIKNLQRRSGARIQLVQLSEGEQVKERTVRVSGDRKQIERAREMIQEVMDQHVRASPVSTGFSQQQTFHPHGPVAPQWGPPPHGPVQNPGYDYRQRGPYQSPSPHQYPAPAAYGNYPPQQAPPRSGFGPSWDQRPPPPMQQGPPPLQVNYNYGPSHPTYQQQPPPSYAQNYGHPGHMPLPSNQYAAGQGMVPQQIAAYPSQGGLTGGPATSYGGMQQQQQLQASHVHQQQQQYNNQQPRGEAPPYNQQPLPPMQPAYNQQQYPYPSTGMPMQQMYPGPGPAYGHTAPSSDGYSQHPQQQPASVGPVYSQQQPIASGSYGPGPQPPTYGSYYHPSQPPADNSGSMGFGYQAPPPAADPYAQSAAATYSGQPSYAQPPPTATQAAYDQSVAAQSGGYVVTQPATQAAATGYGSSV